MNETHKSGTIIVGFNDGIEFTNMSGTMHWNITPLNYKGNLPLPATNHVLRLRKGDQTQRFYVDGGFVQVREDVVFNIRGRRMTVPDLEFIRCDACGEKLFDLEASRKIDAVLLSNRNVRRRKSA